MRQRFVGFTRFEGSVAAAERVVNRGTRADHQKRPNGQ
jgi:hypothetical protein